MQAVVFDVDHTLFDANQVLHEGAAELLAILQRLGVKIGAISGDDHRVLVRLDEAGIRHYFAGVHCNAHSDQPKSVSALHRLLEELEAKLHETTLVSHAHADILLAKDAGLAQTIGVSHGQGRTMPLQDAGADHIIDNIPAVLDVLQ